MSIQIPPPDPMWSTHLGLLALQVALLVLTTGIFVTTMISAYEALSLMRRTLTDTTRICRLFEDSVEATKTSEGRRGAQR